MIDGEFLSNEKKYEFLIDGVCGDFRNGDNRKNDGKISLGFDAALHGVKERKN